MPTGKDCSFGGEIFPFTKEIRSKQLIYYQSSGIVWGNNPVRHDEDPCTALKVDAIHTVVPGMALWTYIVHSPQAHRDPGESSMVLKPSAIWPVVQKQR